MSEINVLLDTSILVEFFDSTKKGEKLKDYVSEKYRLFTPAIVISELASKLKRKGFEPKKMIDELRGATQVVPLTDLVAEESGILHATLRERINNISLADCIIMTHAQKLKAKILTCDNHFKGHNNSIIIE